MIEKDLQNADTNEAQHTAYQVLARKYRSETFDDLIGQNELVTTLKNSITTGRIAHAYILTGIRGTGKTSTARILARALNCLGTDGKNTAPTTTPCGVCENCIAIKEDRHIDVIEMDAASNTGVDDMRELIDGAQYKPTNARYKVYIIDEVHMLSKNAFNALLKTLEEPPEYVKFIFATTDIRKVPMTILSRCQRFELSRIDGQTLKNHFKKISEIEGIKVSDDALNIITRAAGGSVRDGLSILDQAFANSGNDKNVSAELVAKMIGLADREKTFDVFESLMSGDIKSVTLQFKKLCDLGTNPIAFLNDMMEVVHYVMMVKIAPDFLVDLPVSANESEHIKKSADTLSIATLNSVWQMLVRGFTDVSNIDNVEDAVKMLLIKIAYASVQLPDLRMLAEKIDGMQAAVSAPKNIEKNVNEKNLKFDDVVDLKVAPVIKKIDTSEQKKSENAMDADTENIKEKIKNSDNDILKAVMEKFPSADVKL
ncbi:MAG: DNA polymerase III subunit gamma/tau [Rickettsiales bacterium]|jgi:DNA polymerase-3 subunit gamma/tau|nr:DNA polymerase III subunit gamma/tau [Rickettsiales bacterium]